MKRMFRMSGDVAVFKGWDFDFNNEKNLVEGFDRFHLEGSWDFFILF